MLRQVFRWRQPLQRPVGALIVVLIEPSLDDLPGLSDRAEPPAVQAAIAKDPVEALIMAALTGATGRDVMGLYALGRQPLPYRLGDEPRAVVALEIGRWAIVGEKLRQLPLHLGGRDRARHVDLEPDARVLIDHGQTAKTTTVRGLVGYEVDAPDVVRVPGLLRRRCRLVAPQQTHPLSPDAIPLALKVPVDLTVAAPRVAFAQPMQRRKQLGITLELTDDTGTVVWAASYRSYGSLALQHIDALDQALRFQGQYYDEETGLHYNRFRYYDPECGRFINQDPIGLLGGTNNYQYVPNPTGWVDPLGLTAKEVTCGSGASSSGTGFAPPGIDPLLAKHLQSLPPGSYEVIEQVGRPQQGFTNDIAVKIRLLEDVTGVRFSGGGSRSVGPFVAVGELPTSRYQARQALALKSFGRGAYNTMSHRVDVTMKAGAVVYLGEAAPQTSKAGTNYSGGATQVFAEFWRPENAGLVEFSKPVTMPRKSLSYDDGSS